MDGVAACLQATTTYLDAPLPAEVAVLAGFAGIRHDSSVAVTTDDGQSGPDFPKPLQLRL